MAEKKTGAAAYRAAQTTEVKVSSGFVWTMRKVNLQHLIAEGELPTAFVAKVATAMQNRKSPEEVAATLTEEEVKQSVVFFTRLIMKCAVSPRITLGEPTDDEITPEEITTEDFKDLQRWVSEAHALGGGQSAGLAKFRGESAKAADGSTNGA